MDGVTLCAGRTVSAAGDGARGNDTASNSAAYLTRKGEKSTAHKQPQPKRCRECGKPLNYDSFEDCYLCSGKGGCYALFYPRDFGEQDNPNASIWHIGEK